MRVVADVSRLSAEVEWSPKTALKDGLRQAVRFYDRHRHLWSGSGGPT